MKIRKITFVVLGLIILLGCFVYREQIKHQAIELLIRTGCLMDSERIKQQAVEMINRGEADCVVVRANGEWITEKGRGLSPILRIYEQHPDAMHGAFVVDKVIGRAAAMVAIAGQAYSVHGILMSEDARDLLVWRHAIDASYGELVPRILNANRDGLCPLEQSVEGIDDPKQAIEAIKQRISELSAGAR